MSEKSNLNTTILLVGMSSGVFAGFAPSWFTVASPFFHEQGAVEGNIKRIRWAEVAGSAITISMGAILANQESSMIPLVASIFISIIFCAGYEFMISHPSIEG